MERLPTNAVAKDVPVVDLGNKLGDVAWLILPLSSDSGVVFGPLGMERSHYSFL